MPRLRNNTPKPEFSLENIKKIIKNTPDKVVISKRNFDDLAVLGLDIVQAIDIIGNKLNPGHFYGISAKAGCDFADIYKIRRSNIMIYIKLQITSDDGLLIISFHEDR